MGCRRDAGGSVVVSRWLVSNVPPWLLLPGLIVLVAGGAVLILLFVRHRFPRLKGSEYNDGTMFAFGVVGFVFAILVSFVISALWGQISTPSTSFCET
jgi:hypothetical protein